VGVAEYDTLQNEPTGAVTRIAGSMTDQTERKMADPSTGLPNRMYFIDHLERRMERARMGGSGIFRIPGSNRPN
jgi:PleD family two-component response regulator